MSQKKNDQEQKPADTETAARAHDVTEPQSSADAAGPAAGKAQSSRSVKTARKGKDSSATPPPASDSAPARRGPHPLSWINLVLMLGLFAVAAYAGWLSWQQQQDNAAAMAVLRDRVQQAQQAAGNLAAAEGDLLTQTRSLSQQTATLKAQVEHNTDQLGKMPGAERQDWLLAEAEYLLRMASQRLQLERDWEGALSMLQAADNVLLETRNPRLNPVRATLAKEMLALRSVPAVDRTGAVMRLQAIQEQLPQLPWLPDRLLADASPVAEETAAAVQDIPWYLSLWNKVSDSLLSMVRIRERQAPVAAPLGPDQQYFLQQNMHLMLEQAQIALLRQQAELYRHSLQRVAGWMDDYLIVDDKRTRAVRTALQELEQWEVSPQVPDISGSLLQLQQLVEAQRRGTVTPEQAPADAQPAEQAEDAA